MVLKWSSLKHIDEKCFVCHISKTSLYDIQEINIFIRQTKKLAV